MFNVFDYISAIKKLLTRTDFLILLGLVGLFFATRLFNIDKFPIFSDEGIYVHWAKVAWRDANWRFISLTDGRQPLQTWGTIPFLKLFASNALLAGRLFSVATGFFALSGLVGLCTYLFNKRTAYIAALLYIFVPYFLFFDRMALVDSAVNGFTIWLFFLSIVLARTRRLDVALILGFVAGFGMLAKSSMRLYVALMFCSSIFFLYENHEGIMRILLTAKKKIIGDQHKWREMINFTILYGVSVAIAFLIYNVQRLSAYFHFVSEKNKTFILTFDELKADPFNYLSHNIINVPYYIFSEMAYVVPILSIIGLVLLYRKNKTIAIYLLIWITVAYLGISTVARVLFPRYVLSIGGLLLIPAAYAIAQYTKKSTLIIVSALIVCSISYFNYTILLKPASIPFPEIDRGQYLEGWPAGWGAREIVSYVREKSPNATILAEGTFGMAGDVLDTFLLPTDTIALSSFWPLDEKELYANQELLKTKDVYVVFSHRDEFPSEWPLQLIQKYEKPCMKSRLLPFDKLLGNDPALKTCDSALYLFKLTDSQK